MQNDRQARTSKASQSRLVKRSGHLEQGAFCPKATSISEHYLDFPFVAADMSRLLLLLFAFGAKVFGVSAAAAKAGQEEREVGQMFARCGQEMPSLPTLSLTTLSSSGWKKVALHAFGCVGPCQICSHRQR